MGQRPARPAAPNCQLPVTPLSYLFIYLQKLYAIRSKFEEMESRSTLTSLALLVLLMAPLASSAPTPDQMVAENAMIQIESDASHNEDSSSEPLTLSETLPAKCSPNPAKESCFGAQGVGCERVGIADPCPSGQQYVTVGSLVHDMCCHLCVQGQQCGEKAAAGIFTTKSVPCSLEWRKAHWNSGALDARGWCAPMKSTASSVNIVPDSYRKYETSSHWGKYVSTILLPLTEQTKDLCAPEGTKLDCFGPECHQHKGCNGDCPAGMGDSQFCCSGEFKQLDSLSLLGKFWGVCA